MTAKRLATSLAMSGLLALAPSAAMAQDNEASIDNTGPNSTNTVTIENNQSYEENNNQDVTVNNDNDQTATSGDADVSNNTTGGNATSGDASNTNTTSTVVSFGGDVDDGNGGGGGGGGQGGGNLPGGGGSLSGGKGGGSLAAALSGGVGGGALPDTGASFPIDVSALRRAIAGTSSEELAAVNRAKGLSAGLLAAAALMSLLGAAGSAVYAAKKEQSL